MGAKFTLDGIIGHPYGTTFEVQKGNLVKVDKTAKAITDQSTNGWFQLFFLDFRLWIKQLTYVML